MRLRGDEAKRVLLCHLRGAIAQQEDCVDIMTSEAGEIFRRAALKLQKTGVRVGLCCFGKAGDIAGRGANDQIAALIDQLNDGGI